MKLAVRPEPAIRTLAGYFEAAGIAQYAEWSECIELFEVPFPHQIEGLRRLAIDPRFGLYDEPGCGKTFPLQAYMAWLCQLGNRCVAIMPPTLVTQFERSYRHNLRGIEQHLQIEIYAGAVPERRKLLDRWNDTRWPDVLLMSYAMFRTPDNRAPKPPKIIGDETVPLEERKAIALEHREKVLAWQKIANNIHTIEGFCHLTLLDKGYTCLAVDEANVITNPGNKLHKSVAEFAEQDNGLVLMTGTPISNKVEDAYGLIELTSPGWYGSYRNFERTHIIYGFGGEVEEYVNHAHLYRGLYNHGRRVLKKAVKKDMPSRTISEIHVKLEPGHRALYKKLVDERMLELPDGQLIDATTVSSLRQKMQQVIMRPQDFGYHGKNAMDETIDDLLTSLGDRKVLIYAWFRETIQYLQRRYQHLNPAVLYGDVTGDARDQNIAKFIEDPTCRVFIMNQRSGGVGVDGLQKVCSHAIYAEIVPVPGVFQQSIDRLHRTGQTEAVTIYLLVAIGTVAVKMRNSLILKEVEANKIVRDKRTLLADLVGAEGIQGELT